MANPTVTLRLPEPMYAAISAVSAYTGRSAGDLGREAFAIWLENLELDRLKNDLEQEIAAKKETFNDMSEAVNASKSQLEAGSPPAAAESQDVSVPGKGPVAEPQDA